MRRFATGCRSYSEVIDINRTLVAVQGPMNGYLPWNGYLIWFVSRHSNHLRMLTSAEVEMILSRIHTLLYHAEPSLRKKSTEPEVPMCVWHNGFAAETSRLFLSRVSASFWTVCQSNGEHLLLLRNTVSRGGAQISVSSKNPRQTETLRVCIIIIF